MTQIDGMWFLGDHQGGVLALNIPNWLNVWCKQREMEKVTPAIFKNSKHTIKKIVHQQTVWGVTEKALFIAAATARHITAELHYATKKSSFLFSAFAFLSSSISFATSTCLVEQRLSATSLINHCNIYSFMGQASPNWHMSKSYTQAAALIICHTLSFTATLYFIIFCDGCWLDLGRFALCNVLWDAVLRWRPA